MRFLKTRFSTNLILPGIQSDLTGRVLPTEIMYVFPSCSNHADPHKGKPHYMYLLVSMFLVGPNIRLYNWEDKRLLKQMEFIR
jgi:hypothetical protein